MPEQYFCKFDKCNKIVTENISEHISSHINKHSSELYCLWEGCKYKKKMTTESAFVQHIKNHFLDKTHVCKYCFNIFSKEETLKKHEDKHEKDNLKMSKTADEFILLCDKRDEELENLQVLLSERVYHVNLNRILKNELVRDKSKDDSYNDYLN